MWSHSSSVMSVMTLRGVVADTLFFKRSIWLATAMAKRSSLGLGAIPALLMNTSIFPKCEIACCASASTSPDLVTSHFKLVPPSESDNFLLPSSAMSPMTMCAPRLANSLAKHAPRPDAPPVTTTTCPACSPLAFFSFAVILQQ